MPVACGTGDDTAATAEPEKLLHVCNWADYIGESTIQDFEARTGIRVVYDVYDVYDASERLETKLLTGSSGYDVVVPYLRGTTSLHYLMEPEVIADIMNTVGQANGIAASLRYVAEAVRDNPSIYPSEEVYRRLSIDRSWSPEQMHAVNRVWTRIKAAR